MNTLSVPIDGGDFEHGGEASRKLKALLQRSGAEPAAVRRAVIAAYEAEMNVIIHAKRGHMIATIDEDRITIEIADEGPGIPDVDLALSEGWSTAPPRARELGFGAGLGLPNIRRMSDAFHVDTRVGRGTRLRFAIRLWAAAPNGYYRHHLRLHAERCTSCMACVTHCPTKAIRVRTGNPTILGHLCVDCAECVRGCRPHAIEMDIPSPRGGLDARTTVLPGELRWQFGSRSSPSDVDAAAHESFDGDVVWVDGWSEALRRAEWEAAVENAPVISAQCAGIAQLVATSFPSLVPSLSPYRSPVESTARSAGIAPAVAVMCPAQISAAIDADPSGKIECLTTDNAIRKIHSSLHRPSTTRANTPATRSVSEFPNSSPEEKFRDDIFVASGSRHVLEILDRLEDGRLDPCRVLELYLCDGGCLGSPLLTENPWIAARRREAATRAPIPTAGEAVRREMPVVARAALRLDADMAAAMKKFAQIDETTRSLPGRDCAQCGAPDCSTFAEDIVLGRATTGQCPYYEVKP